jgi:hypothetical protein
VTDLLKFAVIAAVVLSACAQRLALAA